MLIRNLGVLLLAQLVSVSGSVTTVLLGGIIGTAISPRADLATLPLSLMVIGTALMSAPAALLMQRIGRRLGFTLGAVAGALAMLLAFVSVREDMFWLFCLATSLYGINLAFTQQFRFAAAESVTAKWVSWAVSVVLLGSIGGALLGPRVVAALADDTNTASYSLAFATIGGLLLASALSLFVVFRDSVVEHAEDHMSARPLRDIVKHAGFMTALSGGVIGYGVMTLIMTATPISMHVNSGHSMDSTAWVISSHVLAMYLPSLFSAALITRFGCRPVMLGGVVLFAMSLLFGLQGHQVVHYWLTLVALGVGWNFLYVGGTTLLTQCYRSSERFKAQAFNDFAVFGISALASVAAGSLMHYLGWTWLMLAPIPVLALVAVMLMRKGEQVSAA
ncbi:MAG: MFS transporter [Pseudomonadota bacterium]